MQLVIDPQGLAAARTSPAEYLKGLALLELLYLLPEVQPEHPAQPRVAEDHAALRPALLEGLAHLASACRLEAVPYSPRVAGQLGLGGGGGAFEEAVRGAVGEEAGRRLECRPLNGGYIALPALRRQPRWDEVDAE